MTPATLQALRRLLFLTPQEAADLIGGVSVRSWVYWEAGQRAIPADVADRLKSLIAWRTQALSASRADSAALVWYPSMDAWATLPGREPVLWRPHQSVCAELAAEGVALVPFDGVTYAAWLAGREDCEAMRGAWAAES